MKPDPSANEEGAGIVAQAAVLRLYPTVVQAGQMRQWIGAARAVESPTRHSEGHL